MKNIYVRLIQRILIIMALFTLCRLAFYFVNYDSFKEVTFSTFKIMLLGGLRFDISAILYINLVFILSQIIPFNFRYKKKYKTFFNYWFLATNALFLAINSADISYYRFTLKRTTASIFEQFSHETNILSLLFRFIFIDYWYITLFWIGLTILMVFFYRKTNIDQQKQKKPIIDYTLHTLLMLIICYLVVGGLRGGFKHSTRPITLSNAGRYVTLPKEMAIVLNTPFSIFRTLSKPIYQEANYFNTQKQLDSIYTPLHKAKTGGFIKKNIIIIILESFGKEYFGVYNKHLDSGAYKGYTPFLDSLVEKSYSFNKSYANGGKSIDAIPSVVSSIPSLLYSYVLTHYSTNKTNSLALLLKKKGYETSFFHGAPNGSMGFLSYTQVNGFDHYYGKKEYGKDEDFDNIWGIWDEEFFQFFGYTMKTFKEPFLSVFFSTTSHHPFKVPDRYKNKFPKGNLPIHQVIGYTDFALQQFFKQVKSMSWYENTLFIITADHTSQSEHSQYQNSIGSKEVPILFFDPSGELNKKSNTIAQQIDITPTVLSYLNYDQEYIAFGNDLFNDTIDHFSISTINNIYQIIMNNYVLHFDGIKSIGLYNLEKDQQMKTNLIHKKLAIQSILENKVRAFIQHYNHKMITNTLTSK